MRTLLVAFDGSESALRAVAYAARRALEQPLALHLALVREEPPRFPDVGVVYDSYEKNVALLRAEGAEILAAGERLAKKTGVPYVAEVLIGPVARSLVQRAAELGCEEIVMGTRGMGAAGNLLLGSVATKVAHAADVPVTLVK